LRSSAYDIPVTLEPVTIAIAAKILTNDIVITSKSLGGSSGLLRLYFSMDSTASADFEITVTKMGEANLTGDPLILNADNGFVIKPSGYYRFDIGVKPGDLINLSSNVAITDIFEFQIQQIQLGA